MKKRRQKGEVISINGTYRRVTRLSPSQVTWNQVQGSTNVRSQLSSTFSGSFKVLLKAYKTSPVHQFTPTKITFMPLRNCILLWVQHFLMNTTQRKIPSLPSTFAFVGAKMFSRVTRRTTWTRVRTAISNSAWKLVNLWLQSEILEDSRR